VTRRNAAQKIQQAADGTAIACFLTVGESSIADKARRVQHPAGVRRAAFDEIEVAERSHPGVGERCGTRLLGPRGGTDAAIRLRKS
jgi:hypothetical protein